MALINDLIAKVSALTAIVNQLTTNSKAIQELPAQETLNPDSLIHVSKDSVSKKISVQQIINAAISNQNDQIISIGTITLSVNELTISEISAKINNVIQSISLPTIINIPFCASGLKRIDLLVYNTSNEIIRIAGTETAGAIVITPTLPINSLLITQISVTDSVISEPQPPILGNTFLQKEFEKAQVVNTSGNAVVIPLNIKGRNNIILNGALTSVTGFSLTNLDANPANAEYPHEGKDYYIQNKTGHAVTLKNFDTTVDIPFLSKDGNDIVVPNNGIVFFKNSSNVLQEFFRSWQTQNTSVSNTDTYTSASTTSLQVLSVTEIPANSFADRDIVNFKALFTKETELASCIITAWSNTTPSLVGASVFYMHNSNITNLINVVLFDHKIAVLRTSKLITSFEKGSGVRIQSVDHSSDPASNNIDIPFIVTAANYIIVTCELLDASDVVKQQALLFHKIN